jgi:hypothetical protein
VGRAAPRSVRGRCRSAPALAFRGASVRDPRRRRDAERRSCGWRQSTEATIWRLKPEPGVRTRNPAVAASRDTGRGAASARCPWDVSGPWSPSVWACIVDHGRRLAAPLVAVRARHKLPRLSRGAAGARATPVRAPTLVGILVAVAFALYAATSPSALAESPVVQTFGVGAGSFTVPAGVTTLQLTVQGGGGGSGFRGGSTGGAGGGGALITGTLGVSPGQTLYLNVGAAGGDGRPPGANAGWT